MALRNGSAPRSTRTVRIGSHMDLAAHLRTHFEEGIELRTRMAATLPAEIARAGEALARSLKSGHKALACGNGGPAAGSPPFAAQTLGRFQRPPPGPPAPPPPPRPPA